VTNDFKMCSVLCVFIFSGNVATQGEVVEHLFLFPLVQEIWKFTKKRLSYGPKQSGIYLKDHIEYFFCCCWCYYYWYCYW